jgi:hypothetical protein
LNPTLFRSYSNRWVILSSLIFRVEIANKSDNRIVENFYPINMYTIYQTICKKEKEKKEENERKELKFVSS